MMAAVGLPLTIAEASRLIEEKALSPVELTQACLDRIAGLDDRLNSFLLVLADSAIAAARQAERAIIAGHRRGPLHGIPIGLKDIFNTKGIRTTANSKVLQDHVPDHDATTVRRLADAGTILLGKLATLEFALGGPSFDLPWPPARNPWNTNHYTGGSSSGTAVAVAAGLVPGGLGSDTGGSIRGPAALCGIAGLKPTYGRVSRYGVLPLAFSLDHAGPMAWTSRDCALLLAAIAGHDPQDPASADLPVPDYARALNGDVRGLRIGWLRHFYQRDSCADDATCAAIEAAIEVFRGLGAEVREITISPLQDYLAPGYVLMISEGYAVHEQNLRTRPQDYGEYFRDRISQGVLFTAGDYVQAVRRRGELVAEFADTLAALDVVVTATAPGPAAQMQDMQKWSSFERPLMTMPFNITGNPAMAICCGFNAAGLPLSLQIVGRHFDEATVLRAADAYERVTPWRNMRPPLA